MKQLTVEEISTLLQDKFNMGDIFADEVATEIHQAIPDIRLPEKMKEVTSHSLCGMCCSCDDVVRAFNDCRRKTMELNGIGE